MTDRVQWIFRPRSKDVDRDQLVSHLQQVGVELDATVAPKVKLTATTEPPPKWNVIPFSSVPLVMISLDTVDRDALAGEATRLGLGHLDLATYERFDVTTSVPVALPVEPTVDAPTPGAELLTLFRRRKGLDDETLIQRWHGVHTPLSLEIHPLWGYIRNVVDARWPNDATPLDGIVEEYFRKPQDLLNPSSFFGGPVKMVPNMARVAWDIRRFIDLSTIETYWVTERWLRV